MPALNHFDLLGDEPTLDDALNRGPIVEELAYRILTCPTPLVLGIHGDWGSGKTSFLLQLQDLLNMAEFGLNAPPTKETRIPIPVTVRFDAWRYQNESAPVVALLSAIREEFSRIAKTTHWLKKMGDVTIRSLLSMLSDIGKFIQFEVMPDAAKIQAFGEQWEKDRLANKLTTDTAQEFLQEAINILLRGSTKATPTQQRRVVVFIDDLDRCEPEAAYKLLEGLKVYLHLKNCVFILGMNQRAVEDAIASRLPKSLENQENITRIRAAAYLEKICQNVWRLPLPEDPANILLGWVRSQIQSGGGNPQLDLNQFSQTFAAALTGSNGQALRCMPPNPRKLKGLANFLLRHLDLLPQGNDATQKQRDFRSLLVVAYVFQFHHDLFVRWQYEPKLYDLILRWVRNELTEEAKPVFLKSLQLPESLVIDSSTPTPTFRSQPNYPDPGEANLFWIAPLLLEMATGHVATDFVPYLKCQP